MTAILSVQSVPLFLRNSTLLNRYISNITEQHQSQRALMPLNRRLFNEKDSEGHHLPVEDNLRESQLGFRAVGYKAHGPKKVPAKDPDVLLEKLFKRFTFLMIRDSVV